MLLATSTSSTSRFTQINVADPKHSFACSSGERSPSCSLRSPFAPSAARPGSWCRRSVASSRTARSCRARSWPEYGPVITSAPPHHCESWPHGASRSPDAATSASASTTRPRRSSPPSSSPASSWPTSCPTPVAAWATRRSTSKTVTRAARLRGAQGFGHRRHRRRPFKDTLVRRSTRSSGDETGVAADPPAGISLRDNNVRYVNRWWRADHPHRCGRVLEGRRRRSTPGRARRRRCSRRLN